MKRILVVDDEEGIREIFGAILSHAGYECVMVPNGDEAIKVLESGQRFDLITTDIANEPWGTAFIELLKLRFPKIPRLVITGCHDMPDALHKSELGPEQLIAAVRDAIAA
jgi:DNA-binding NtrC family response regulator